MEDIALAVTLVPTNNNSEISSFEKDRSVETYIQKSIPVTITESPSEEVVEPLSELTRPSRHSQLINSPLPSPTSLLSVSRVSHRADVSERDISNHNKEVQSSSMRDERRRIDKLGSFEPVIKSLPLDELEAFRWTNEIVERVDQPPSHSTSYWEFEEHWKTEESNAVHPSQKNMCKMGTNWESDLNSPEICLPLSSPATTAHLSNTRLPSSQALGRYGSLPQYTSTDKPGRFFEDRDFRPPKRREEAVSPEDFTYQRSRKDKRRLKRDG